jgi:hypothetical protein
LASKGGLLLDGRAYGDTTMSTQALDSQRVRDGLKDTLLGPAQLYESLPFNAAFTKLLS